MPQLRIYWTLLFAFSKCSDAPSNQKTKAMPKVHPWIQNVLKARWNDGKTTNESLNSSGTGGQVNHEWGVSDNSG